VRKIMLLIVVLLVPGPSAFGQYAKYNPYAPAPFLAPGPREKRAAREFAIARVGIVARSLVETYGESAVNALFACSVPVGQRLAEFHNAGKLAEFPRPAALLDCIGQPGNGDDVALWAMQPEHARQLTDPAAFEAYLLAPLDHALGLRDLATSAAEVRAHRIASQAPRGLSALPRWLDGQVIVGGLAVLGIVILFLWRKRQRS
jgi:hypothetical protein